MKGDEAIMVRPASVWSSRQCLVGSFGRSL
jgi:hypothetical protein